jgi:murein DD-endopeptidase MepM/ murein hydrolase activator NlpD
MLKARTDTAYRWPLPAQYTQVTSPYGVMRSGVLHTGVDIAAPIGTPLYAPANGTVVQVCPADCWRYGNMLMLRHTDGTYTRYAHLQRILVQPNQRVSRGQQIGTTGNTGASTGPHLHLEARRTWSTASQQPGHFDPFRLFVVDRPARTWLWLGLGIVGAALLVPALTKDRKQGP